VAPLSFAADNLTLWLVSREEHDRGALYAYNTRTCERGPAAFVPRAGEIDSLVTSYDESKLLGVVYETEKLNYHWFDDGRRTVQASVEAAFPGYVVVAPTTPRTPAPQFAIAPHETGSFRCRFEGARQSPRFDRRGSCETRGSVWRVVTPTSGRFWTLVGRPLADARSACEQAS